MQSSSSNNIGQDLALQQYRKKQEFLFNLKKKYSKLLEFNKKERNNWRLSNAFRRKLLFSVFNISDEEIKTIPGMYRYRCYLYDVDETELLLLNSAFDAHSESIRYEQDLSVRSVLLESLVETRKLQLTELFNSDKTMKIPVLLDLRIYGMDPDTPIFFGDKVYNLDEITKSKIKKSHEKINSVTIKGERFIQLMNHGKILRDSYWNEIQK
jgi:hypothetical protein